MELHGAQRVTPGGTGTDPIATPAAQEGEQKWDDHMVLANMKHITLWQMNIDPETHHVLVESNLPTPIC